MANISTTILRERQQNYDVIFPFTSANYNAMWRNALTKANLLKRDSRTNRMTMRPHNLRKFFRLRVAQYGRDEAESLMGHQKGLNAIYARFEGEYGDKRLEETYVKSIPELSIYKRSIHLAKVRQEIIDENKELRLDITNLKAQRDEFLNTINNLQEELGKVKEKDVTLENEINGIKHLYHELIDSVASNPEQATIFANYLLDAVDKTERHAAHWDQVWDYILTITGDNPDDLVYTVKQHNETLMIDIRGYYVNDQFKKVEGQIIKKV
jgi:hypothetical protein